MGLPQFVPEVDADHSGVVFVLLCKLLADLKELIFREFVAPPESIAIVVGAAPHGRAGVVVEDDHEAYIGERLDCDVEYL